MYESYAGRSYACRLQATHWSRSVLKTPYMYQHLSDIELLIAYAAPAYQPHSAPYLHISPQFLPLVGSNNVQT